MIVAALSVPLLASVLLKVCHTSAERILWGSVIGGSAAVLLIAYAIFKHLGNKKWGAMKQTMPKETTSTAALYNNLRNMLFPVKARKSALHELSPDDLKKFVQHFQAQVWDEDTHSVTELPLIAAPVCNFIHTHPSWNQVSHNFSHQFQNFISIQSRAPLSA